MRHRSALDRPFLFCRRGSAPPPIVMRDTSGGSMSGRVSWAFRATSSLSSCGVREGGDLSVSWNPPQWQSSVERISGAGRSMPEHLRWGSCHKVL